ncbi:serine/threonine-protein kinase [Streptomyces sp. NPDC048211]|uniref:serine/threonine-protein kinase n=1 Tax=Streptomyces sp. NPDC048211 TaxID=3365516 RepID=UPI0037145D1D
MLTLQPTSAEAGGGMERGQLLAGRYELLKRIGRGGMGEVWAGRDRDLHRDIALKLLVLDDGSFIDLPKRFDREAVAAAQINHPNVVSLYDRGMHEDMLFIVMERVEGHTLSELIASDSPLGVTQALALASDVCGALVAAHAAGVIHYDIKPHNVMLTAERQVKIVDFGIAGFLQTTFSVAHSSQLAPAGTPEYGAPEQFGTERGDARSDLYALGGVLFAMLSGYPPFTGPSGLAVMRRKIDEEAPSLNSVRPGLPPALVKLVAELLARDPAQRPSTAREVQARLGALRRALNDAPTCTAAAAPTIRSVSPELSTRASPPMPPELGNPPPPRSLFRRNSVYCALAALVVVCGLLLGYRWTQSQYYVGAKDGHVAVYRGIGQNVAWISLADVYQDHPEVELRFLPAYQRKLVESKVRTGSLRDARTMLDELARQALACKKTAEGARAGASPPELSTEEEQLAVNCGIAGRT